jgi:PadR family transcriptional regulator PadR
MKLLTGYDEIFLLTILKLKDNAYGVTIRREISRLTGREWSIGAIYDPLYRLEKKSFIESHLSDPTEERGGRSKRMFRVNEKGIEALLAHKKIREGLWRETEELAVFVK